MSSPALEFRGVGKALDGQSVLEDVSFAVNVGEIVGLIGPNGAGKTTTLRLSLGLLRPDDGEVLVDGGSPATTDTRREVAFCFEDDGVYDALTGRENIEFFKIAYESSVDTDGVLARVGLTQAAEKLAGKYSRGMRKRLGVARTLLIKPRLVLLDEPYSGLDPEGQEDLSRLLTSLAEHSAVMVSSHDLHTLEALCDRVVLLRRTVLYSGPTREIDPSATGESRTTLSLMQRYMAIVKGADANPE